MQLSIVNSSSVRGGVWRASSIYAIAFAALLSCRWPQLLWVHDSQPCGVQKTAFHIMSPYPPVLKFFYIPFWDGPRVLGSSSLIKVSHLRHDTQFLFHCTLTAAHCKTHSLWPRLRTAQVYRKKKFYRVTWQCDHLTKWSQSMTSEAMSFWSRLEYIGMAFPPAKPK